MELPIPDKVKKLWDIWNLRGCIMVSLLLQAFLVFFGSFRQRCKSSLLLTLIWAAYLLADWVAAVAIGLITQSQGQVENYDHPKYSKGRFDQDVYAFWASFLLLHLGGPDTITSFALEDNEFWLRHFFGLILQVLAAAYSFYLTIPKNKLWPPTLLVFLVGIIKYAERTQALYLASLDRFGRTILPKPDPGPDYEEASTIYSSRLLHIPTQAEMSAAMTNRIGSISYDPQFDFESIPLEASDEMKLLRVAYNLFESFKRLIVGFYLTSKDRESSRNLFLKYDHKSAFRLMEYELSFMFQVLHTKLLRTISPANFSYQFFQSVPLVLCRSICFWQIRPTTIKQGRGKTRNLQLAKKTRKGKEKLDATLPIKSVRVVGKNAQLITTEIGVVVDKLHHLLWKSGLSLIKLKRLQ